MVNRPCHCSVSGDNPSVSQGCLLCKILEQIACCKGRQCLCSQARKKCKRLLESHLPTAGFRACILIRLGTESRRNSAVATAFSAVMSKPVMCSFEEPALPPSPARALREPSRSLCLLWPTADGRVCLLVLVVRIIFIELRAVFTHPEFGERPSL